MLPSTLDPALKGGCVGGKGRKKSELCEAGENLLGAGENKGRQKEGAALEGLI